LIRTCKDSTIFVNYKFTNSARARLASSRAEQIHGVAIAQRLAGGGGAMLAAPHTTMHSDKEY
jgi:hypothetical protein